MSDNLECPKCQTETVEDEGICTDGRCSSCGTQFYIEWELMDAEEGSWVRWIDKIKELD